MKKSLIFALTSIIATCVIYSCIKDRDNIARSEEPYSIFSIKEAIEYIEKHTEAINFLSFADSSAKSKTKAFSEKMVLNWNKATLGNTNNLL